MQKYLNEDEQRRLMRAAKRCADPLAQRDYHWMGVLILTGMRVQEFSRQSVPRVRLALASGWLTSDREHCKGKRRPNQYCVTQRLRAHLEALVRISDAGAAELGHDFEGEQPLVWGRDGQALSVRSYEARLKMWANDAGLDPRISPHWLRHTRAMNIMRRSRGDNPLKVTQIAMNHASLSSTGIYLQMSKDELERELQLVDGGRIPKRAARRLADGARP